MDANAIVTEDRRHPGIITALTYSLAAHVALFVAVPFIIFEKHKVIHCVHPSLDRMWSDG